jgi:hypothetical protein
MTDQTRKDGDNVTKLNSDPTDPLAMIADTLKLRIKTIDNNTTDILDELVSERKHTGALLRSLSTRSILCPPTSRNSSAHSRLTSERSTVVSTTLSAGNCASASCHRRSAMCRPISMVAM